MWSWCRYIWHLFRRITIYLMKQNNACVRCQSSNVNLSQTMILSSLDFFCAFHPFPKKLFKFVNVFMIWGHVLLVVIWLLHYTTFWIIWAVVIGASFLFNLEAMLTWVLPVLIFMNAFVYLTSLLKYLFPCMQWFRAI